MFPPVTTTFPYKLGLLNIKSFNRIDADTDLSFNFDADSAPIDLFRSESWCDFHFDSDANPFYVPHQSDSNLQPLVYRPSRLYFEPLSLHCERLRKRPSIAPFWVPQLQIFELWCGSGFGSCFLLCCKSSSSFLLSKWCVSMRLCKETLFLPKVQ